MVSVHFVTLLVFILGAAVVRMNAVRRLCYCSGPATWKCLSRWLGEPLLGHSGCRAVTWWCDCKVAQSTNNVAVAGH